MFNNIFQAKFSLKTILLLSSIILFSCEDDAKDSAINGTFQLSEKSQDCEGYEEIEYMTINNTTVTFYEYMNDACNNDNDSDAEDCYGVESVTLGRDGNVLTGVGTGTGFSVTLILSGKELTVDMTDGYGFEKLYYDHISDDIKTYTPVCSWSAANY
jgi:hypothetical protein